MPALLVDSEELRFKLLLFDLDGTLIDDADRYKNLAALRFEALIMRAGRAPRKPGRRSEATTGRQGLLT